ncbi:hypothetical protein [[Clostridium] fimetarium]|uniref:Uncharacterized protein n=1 Tax=[Clostridium] fimetarium TaxID=99656 RepID=A0A1I0RE43_9FIRM|nr:hypothetical protein [[Clostridium] fimetarium]SEW38937.1 hypothetical protein SAMN05421659_11465 [[Clostridium] fimetarium]
MALVGFQSINDFNPVLLTNGVAGQRSQDLLHFEELLPKVTTNIFFKKKERSHDKK